MKSWRPVIVLLIPLIIVGSVACELSTEDEEASGERVCCLCGFEDDLGIVYDPYPVSDERGDLCCRDCWTAKVKPLREEASGE